MGLLQRFLGTGAPRARIEPTLTPHAAGNVQSESQWSHGFVGGAPSRAGVRVTERTAIGLPAVLQALRVLSGVFASAPLNYYRRTPAGKEKAEDSPLYALLHDRPNRHQSAFAFRELLLADVLLAGNFFAYVSRDFTGQPVALTRIEPRNVLVSEYFDRATGRELFYDALLPDGASERFSDRDIWHVAGITRDGLVGLNPLAYMRDALGGAIATSDYANRFWANNAKPSTVLTAKGRIPPEVKRQIKDDWAARFQGPNGDAIAVLDQELEPKFLSQDNQTSQFVETRTFQVLDVARAWGVPPHLIFEMSKATFGNIEQQSLEFVIFHLGPHFERVASAANRAFAEPDGYFEHLTDALVKGDLKTRWEAYNAARQAGVFNADEIRARENLNNIGGQAGTERWRPANMMVAGQPNPPAA